MGNDFACDCGGRLFAFQPLIVTHRDGRSNILAGDIRFPWVLALKCIACRQEWVTGTQRGPRTLYPFGSPEAIQLIQSLAPDMDQDFDPRNKKPQAVAP